MQQTPRSWSPQGPKMDSDKICMETLDQPGKQLRNTRVFSQ